MEDYLQENSEETELHIIAHSLGSVILWDVLFSNRFASDDPAYQVRSLLKPGKSASRKQVELKSITTLGSPILFFNMMLGISSDQLATFVARYQKSPLRWLNIIHAADLIAYPLRASLNANVSAPLFIRDKYILADANLAEKTARTLGQIHAASALGVADAHNWYWHSHRTAHLIAANLLGNRSTIEADEPYEKLPFFGLG